MLDQLWFSIMMTKTVLIAWPPPEVGVFVGVAVLVGAGVFVGVAVRVGAGVFVGVDVLAGAGVFVGVDVLAGAGVIVEVDVLAGAGVVVVAAVLVAVGLRWGLPRPPPDDADAIAANPNAATSTAASDARIARVTACLDMTCCDLLPLPLPRRGRSRSRWRAASAVR